MKVTRVKDATGTHIKPPLDQTWDEETKLRWHAAVVAHDTGLTVGLHPHADALGRTWYGITIGEIDKGGQSSLAGGPYRDAWDLLSHVSIGAQAVIARVRQLHRPVDYYGLTICAECSAWDGSTTDNSPCDYEHCPTLKAIAGQEAP